MSNTLTDKKHTTPKEEQLIKELEEYKFKLREWEKKGFYLNEALKFFGEPERETIQIQGFKDLIFSLETIGTELNEIRNELKKLNNNLEAIDQSITMLNF